MDTPTTSFVKNYGTAAHGARQQKIDDQLILRDDLPIDVSMQQHLQDVEKVIRAEKGESKYRHDTTWDVLVEVLNFLRKDEDPWILHTSALARDLLQAHPNEVVGHIPNPMAKKGTVPEPWMFFPLEENDAITAEENESRMGSGSGWIRDGSN